MKRDRGGAISRLVVLLFLFLLCIGLYLIRGPVLRMVAQAWIVEDPMQKSDAILVMGDDFYADRATRAAELYRQGLASKVVASGEQVRPGASIAQLMEHDLFERGVPKDRIIRFSQSADSIAGEAIALERFVAEHHWHSVIVVTSNYKTRRTRYIFRRIFPDSIQVAIAGAQDAEFDPVHWYEKRNSIKRFILEVGGMGVSIWDFRNRQDQHAGALLLVETGSRCLRDVV